MITITAAIKLAMAKTTKPTGFAANTIFNTPCTTVQIFVAIETASITPL